MKKLKSILSISLIMALLSTMLIFPATTTSAASTLVWDTASAWGSWTATGNDVAAASGSGDYSKYVTTSSIDGISSVKDLTFSAKIYTGNELGFTAGGASGDGFYFSLRDSGTPGAYGGITFMFDAGTKRVFIKNGSTLLADYGLGYFGDTQFAIDSLGYLDVSVTLVGDKMTSLKFGGIEVTGIIINGQAPYAGNILDLVLPITTAGRISTGSFTAPPTYGAGVKDVVVTSLDPVATPTPTPTPTATPTPTVAPSGPSTLIWDTASAWGSWTATGNDVAAASGSGDYIKYVTTSSIDGVSSVKDLSFSAKVYTGKDQGFAAGGSTGPGFYFSLRDTGAPGAYGGITFMFDAGTNRVSIMSGSTTLADYGNGYFGDTQFVIDAQGYIDVKVTLVGNKMTSMKFGGVEITGLVIVGQAPYPGNILDLTLPVTTAGRISAGSFTAPPTYGAGIKDVVVTVMDPPAPIGDWAVSAPTTNATGASVGSDGLQFVASPTSTATDFRTLQKTFGGSSDFTIEYVQKAGTYYVGAAFGIGFSTDTAFAASCATNGLTARYNMPNALSGQMRYFDGITRKDNSAGFTQAPINTYAAGPIYTYKRVKIVITSTTLQVWAQNDSGDMIQTTAYPIPVGKQSNVRNTVTIFATASTATMGDFIITHDGVTTREFKVGTNYYVSQTDGNDANDGLTSLTPWKTFANFTSARVLTPGTQVLLKRGDVWNERLTIQGAGSITNWLYIGAYGDETKAKPIISLTNARDDIGLLYQDIISVMPISSPIGYAQFENLDIRNTRLGLYVRQITTRGAVGLKVTNCDFSNINSTPVMTELAKTDADIAGELSMTKGNLPFFNGSYQATGGGNNEYIFPTAVMVGGISQQATLAGGYPANPMISEITVKNCVFEKSINGILSWMYLYNDGTYKDSTKNWIVDNCVITGTVNGIMGFDSVNGGYTTAGNYWGKITNNKVIYGSDTDTFKDGTTGLISQGSKNFLYDTNTFSNVKRNGRNDGCGFDFEGGNENIILQNSVFSNNDGQAILMMKSTGSMINSNITIKNNLFYNNLVNRASSSYDKEITIWNSDNTNIQLLNNTRYSNPEATALATSTSGVTESGTIAGDLSTYVEAVPQIAVTASLYSGNQIMVKASGAAVPFFADSVSTAGFSASNLPGGVGLTAVTKLNYNTVILTFNGLVSNKLADFISTVTANANQFIAPFANAISGLDSMGKVQSPVTYSGSVSNALSLSVPVIFGTYNVTLGGTNIVSNIAVGSTSTAVTSGLTVRAGTSLAFGSLAAGSVMATGSTIGVTTSGYTTTYTALIYGDINSDGAISLADLASLKSHLLQISPLAGINLLAANTNKTGNATISDLLAIKKHILTLSTISQS